MKVEPVCDVELLTGVYVYLFTYSPKTVRVEAFVKKSH